jgi:hypothetical protein
MLKLSSFKLRRAAEIQGEIEKLEGEVRNLLAPEARNRGARKTLIARQARTGDRRTGVAASVRQILRKRGKPMKVAEIYRRLVTAGYSFRSSNPRNSLTAQMYRMRGVRRTGPGEFSVK